MAPRTSSDDGHGDLDEPEHGRRCGRGVHVGKAERFGPPGRLPGSPTACWSSRSTASIGTWAPGGGPFAAGTGCADGHLYTLGFTGLGATVDFRILDGTDNNQEWFFRQRRDQEDPGDLGKTSRAPRSLISYTWRPGASRASVSSRDTCATNRSGSGPSTVPFPRFGTSLTRRSARRRARPLDLGPKAPAPSTRPTPS